MAHRVSFALDRGFLPSAVLVLHKCDNRQCVRPSHLSAGTHRENMADMAVRGRAKRQLGEAHGMSRITAQDVQFIRQQRAAGITAKVLAERFGYTITAVRLIASGVSWKST